jgi:hypothetical protein
MIKKHDSTYGGMSKDVSSDLQTEMYFDAKNIRIIATDEKSSFSVTNEVGNSIIFNIPIPSINTGTTSIDYGLGELEIQQGASGKVYYATETQTIPRCKIEESYNGLTSGTQLIIGTKELRDSALIITTDSNGWDCFWELKNLNEGDFTLNLLYLGNLGLSTANLVQILYNYENSVIEKIYFVNGVHQLRFMNIRQSIINGDSKNLIDVNPDSIDVVSNFSLSQPEVLGVISGGSHTSGKIQYAYGLYVLNGAQTTISPPSELVAINKGVGEGGGDINEVLGRAVQISIPNIDKNFSYIKIYSIKYTSLNQIPEIKIVADRLIDNFNSLLFTDDNSSQQAISLESFIFLGSAPIIPKHIAIKDNRLFPINIKEIPFDIDLDTRAYSFDGSSPAQAFVLDGAYVNDELQVEGTTEEVVNFSLRKTHDSINKDYEVYKYQNNGSTLGATGKYVEVEVLQTTLTSDQSKDLQFFKDRELYRIGIKFFNKRGQTSEPSWVMDLKAPSGNLLGNYNQLKVTLTSEFYTWLNDSSNFESEDDKPIGYKILRADRTLTDQTIFGQGMINPMVANWLSDNNIGTMAEWKDAVNSTGSNKSDIIPSMTRMFENIVPFNGCSDYLPLIKAGTEPSSSLLGQGPTREGFFANYSGDTRAQNFQHNRMMQFFSPEVTFRNNPIDASYMLDIIGLAEQSDIACWSTETNPINAVSGQETVFRNGINSASPGVIIQEQTGSATNLDDKCFFGPANSDTDHTTHQIYREFKGTFHPSSGSTKHQIYGSPELTQEGADFKNYNGNPQLRYSNNLKTMKMDNFTEDGPQDGAEVRIKGCNTIGAKCVTFAEGSDPALPLDARKSIEQMHTEAATGATNGVLIAEFSRESYLLYTGGFYGGMSNESKSVSTYIDIGSFSPIINNSITINSPGDTFVNTFTFSKMTKGDTEIQDQDYNIMSEIVSINVETTVDLKNRNDLSLGEWNNRWQPRMEEYQKYNTVYSQQPTLIKSVDTGNKIKKIKEFDARLVSSKEKIPGEFIDSWTDLLENEVMDLDGKYGPINAVVNLNDNIFCLQDTAVSIISINPRAQVQAQDGISLELGTGGILHDYKYLTSTVGCLNKWGVISSESAFYFVDVINRGIMTFDGQKIGRLTDSKGFHHEMLNRMNYKDLVKDNAVLGNGLSLGYNPVNADVYFTFLQSNDSFTLGFNEKVSQFISFYDYTPAWYINKGSVLISSSPGNVSLWEHFKGVPNNFYGTSYPSKITLHVAPAGNEIILNNASYKMELVDSNGVEIPNSGLTKVRVYNDYQDSGEVTLALRKNVFKKFRNWKINFPRQSGSRDRVRSAWGFAEFIFENTEGNKLILHNISIFYTQY